MSDLEHVAIERLKIASEMSLQHYGLPLVVTDSGGKDSQVCKELAIRAGIPFEIIHNHTTADAPETGGVTMADNRCVSCGEVIPEGLMVCPSCEKGKDCKKIRLIDANALTDTIEGIDWYHVDKMGYLVHGANSAEHTPLYKAESIYNAIKNATTVDAVEVVHGRWEDVKETSLYVPDMKYTVTHTAETCSACKVRIGFIGSKQYLYDNICPNCGAKMDGDGDF